MSHTQHIALPAKITVDNANAVYLQLQQLMCAGKGGACIDLSAVSHCDSAGVAALVEIKSEQLARGQQVTYISANRQLRDLARFLKVEELLFGV